MNVFNLDDSKNSLSKLRSRGFEILNTGMDFIVGSLFSDDNDESSFQEIDSYFIFCKILIGRSYCKVVQNVSYLLFIKNKLDHNVNTTDISYDIIKSKGFDSIMFCPADNNYSKQKNFGIGLNKSFRYRIFDSTNILPMYFVMFIPHDPLSSYSAKRICEECEVKDADLYCTNDECYLCNECSSIIHGEASNDKSIKQIFDHVKIPISSKIKPGKCFFDQEKDVEFFCKVCNLPICSYCKVVGSHSKGDAMNHPYEDIYTAYVKFNPESNEIIKLCEDKKKKGADSLVKIKNQVE